MRGLIERIDDFDLATVVVVDVGCTVRGSVFGEGCLAEGVVSRGGGVVASVGEGDAAVEGVVGVVVGDGSC